MTTEKQTNLTPFTMFGAVSYLAIRGPNTLQRKDIDQSGEHHFANAVATVSGVPIANLQTLLIGLGANIDADGVFGAETEEALKQIVGKPDYQIQRGDLAVLCDLVVGHLVAARPPAAADPARPPLSLVDTPPAAETKEEAAAEQAAPSGLPIFYRQEDPDWSTRELGKGKTIGEVGCAMCSCAMVAAHAVGNNAITPAPRAGEAESPINHLDVFLDRHDGYDGNSIYWGKVGEFVAQHGVVMRYERVRGLDGEGYLQRIRDLLAEGVFPVVRILHQRGLHFMLAVRATEGGSIFVHDPGSQWGDGRTDREDNILQSMKRYGEFSINGLDFYRVA